MVDRGEDPQEALARRLSAAQEQKRQQELMRFDAYVDRFLKEYGKAQWRDGTYRNVDSAFRTYVKPRLGESSLLTIKRANITAVLDSIPAERQALRRTVYAYLRKLFGWAVARGDLDKSPLDGMQAPAAVADRDRVLADDELRLIWTASARGNATFGTIVRLLILTGQRRDEVAEMSWGELDRKARLWTIPAARTKNGLEHLVPCSEAVIEELDRLANQTGVAEKERRWPTLGFVLSGSRKKPFSGFSKAKASLDSATQALAKQEAQQEGKGPREWKAWRLHDLRRTLITGMQRLGVRFEVTEAIANHVSGAKSGVAGVYQRHDWKDEKRAALTAWARHVEGLLRSGETNVVSFRRA